MSGFFLLLTQLLSHIYIFNREVSIDSVKCIDILHGAFLGQGDAIFFFR